MVKIYQNFVKNNNCYLDDFFCLLVYNHTRENFKRFSCLVKLTVQYILRKKEVQQNGEH